VSSDVEWRWADPAGQQRLVREDELRASLTSGLIPPNAPVWKDGWKDWQPAYAVPELTTSALAAANGVVQNIPPPPLGVLGAQKYLEKEGAALNLGRAKSEARAEPPPPPRYVPTATRVSQVAPAPGSGRQLAPAPGSGKRLPDAKPSSPDETVRAAPASDGKGVADESNTGVKLPVLTDMTAAQAPAGIDAKAEAKPAEKGKSEEPKKENLPTTVGVPALPQSVLADAAAAAGTDHAVARGRPEDARGEATRRRLTAACTSFSGAGLPTSSTKKAARLASMR
jgi:hypothetical protein